MTNRRPEVSKHAEKVAHTRDEKCHQVHCEEAAFFGRIFKSLQQRFGELFQACFQSWFREQVPQVIFACETVVKLLQGAFPHSDRRIGALLHWALQVHQEVSLGRRLAVTVQPY